MSNPIYTTRPAETVSGADAFAELALDLRWSYNHATDVVWQRLDPELWNLTHNPWFVLQTVPTERLKAVAADPEFRRLTEDLLREKREAIEAPAWFPQAHPDASLRTVAYFSMEFMLTEALPIYSGGLGNVAGDQLKTASNLGVPLVGVGLLYQQGYFRQQVDFRGRQQALYPFNDPGQLPIRPMREQNGEWLRFSIPFANSVVWIRVWQVQIGRVQLYLLDTNDPANAPSLRAVTSELYGGDAELRLKQEMVLGIGGWRMLRAAGLAPDVCHLNEGHAALAVLERARCDMADHGRAFDLALTVTRAGNLFTTHTPVEAGFDRFSPELVRRYLAPYVERDLGIGLEDVLALGRSDPFNASEPFNMAYLAVHGSGAVNGVSRLHGEVSRQIFQPLFPRWPQIEVPVGHVTNGVHAPTWDAKEADDLWERACGKDRWRSTRAPRRGGRAGEPDSGTIECDFRQVSDEDLWRLRAACRASLVAYVRQQMCRQIEEQGSSPLDVSRTAATFDENALTVGFARRFAVYKRPNLLLHDLDRLARLLTDSRRPVQLVVAGKAHPADQAGQSLIEQWVAFIKRPDVSGRVTFLADYDMLMAEHLVRGIDVWINTPRRPFEACGTSGMKVLVNGGLNLSELDGWWAEAYAPDVGWAIGDGQDRGEDPSWDAAEADALYERLERDIVPEFYARDEHGIPRAWVARIRRSMTRLTPAFSADRAVREYVERYYLPAAAAYRERAADHGRIGAEVLAWRRMLEKSWATASFGALEIDSQADRYVLRVRVDLGTLDPDGVEVQLYADGLGGQLPVREPMRRAGAGAGANTFVYTAEVPATRPQWHFTPRLVPRHPGASNPLEAPFILWNEGRR